EDRLVRPLPRLQERSVRTRVDEDVIKTLWTCRRPRWRIVQTDARAEEDPLAIGVGPQQPVRSGGVLRTLALLRRQCVANAAHERDGESRANFSLHARSPSAPPRASESPARLRSRDTRPSRAD